MCQPLPHGLLLIWFALASVAIAQEPKKNPNELLNRPIELWINDLQSSDALAQEEALLVLRKHAGQAKPAIEPIIKLLKSEATTVRLNAALTLWMIEANGKKALPVIEEMLTKLNANQLGQVYTFCRQLPADQELISAYLAMANQPNFAGDFEINNKLLQSSTKVIPIFKEMLTSIEAKKRPKLISIIPYQFIVGELANDIAKLMTDPIPETRYIVAANFATTKKYREIATQELLKIANGNDALLAERATMSLGQLRPLVKEANELFAKAIQSPNENVSVKVAQAYLEMNPNKISEILPLIEKWMKSPNYQTQTVATQILYYIREPNEAVGKFLLERIRNANPVYEASRYINTLVIHAKFVGKDVGELIFDPTKKQIADVLITPQITSLTPYMTESIKKHLVDPRSPQRSIAFRVLQFGHPSIAKEFEPILTEMISKEPETISQTLTIMENFGPNVKKAAVTVLSILDRADGNKYVQQVTKVIRRMRPESKDVENVIKKLATKDNLSQDERFLLVELYLLDPKTHQNAAETLLPLLTMTNRGFVTLELQQLVKRTGKGSQAFIPKLKILFEQDLKTVGQWISTLKTLDANLQDLIPSLIKYLENSVNNYEQLDLAILISKYAPEQRGKLDEIIKKSLQTHMTKLAKEPYYNYDFNTLEEFCRTKPGPTKAFEESLASILKQDKLKHIHCQFADLLVTINPIFKQQTLEHIYKLKEHNINTDNLLTAICRIDPDDRWGNDELLKSLKSEQTYIRYYGVSTLIKVGQPLKKYLPQLLDMIKVEKDPGLVMYCKVAKCRLQNSLDDDLKTEILNQLTAYNYYILWAQLGSLGKPLIPYLRNSSPDKSYQFQIDRLIAQFERD